MTIICAIKRGPIITIGSDTVSICISSSGQRRVQHHGPKWAVGGKWAIAVSGQMRLQCLVDRHLDDLTRDLEYPLEFTDRLINQVFARYEVNRRSEVGAPDCGSVFMLAGPLGLFEIDCTLSVRPVPERQLAAIGCGAPIALGAAHALAGIDSITEIGIVRRSVEAAIAHDPDCGGESWVHEIDIGVTQ